MRMRFYNISFLIPFIFLLAGGSCSHGNKSISEDTKKVVGETRILKVPEKITLPAKVVEEFKKDRESAKTLEELNTLLEQLRIPLQKFVLANGLKVLVVEKQDLPIVSYYTYYDVGGRHERPGFTGASHFLEHLMFKGAKKYGEGAFDRIIEGAGGTLNAYTTFDSTVYYESFPSSELEQVIDLEADRMVNLLLEPVGFEKERQVVLEERKMRYENSPRGQLYLRLMEEMYKGTPYAGSVIGTKKDLKQINRDDVFTYFKEFYAPNNAVVVIVGDVKFKAVKSLFEKYFSPLEASKNFGKIKEERDRLELYKSQFKQSKWVKLYGQSPTPMFALSFPSKELGNREAYALDLVANILGTGQSSFLYQKYVLSNRPEMISISASNYNLKFGGSFFVMGELHQKVDPNRIRQKLLKDLKKSCRSEIQERSLQKARNQFLVGLFQGIKTTAGLAEFVGQREHFFQDFHQNFSLEISTYMSMSIEEVRAVCEEVFSRPSLMVSVWNKHSK